jgi:hypothetical protein
VLATGNLCPGVPACEFHFRFGVIYWLGLRTDGDIYNIKLKQPFINNVRQQHTLLPLHCPLRQTSNMIMYMYTIQVHTTQTWTSILNSNMYTCMLFVNLWLLFNRRSIDIGHLGACCWIVCMQWPWNSEFMYSCHLYILEEEMKDVTCKTLVMVCLENFKSNSNKTYYRIIKQI